MNGQDRRYLMNDTNLSFRPITTITDIEHTYAHVSMLIKTISVQPDNQGCEQGSNKTPNKSPCLINCSRGTGCMDVAERVLISEMGCNASEDFLG